MFLTGFVGFAHFDCQELWLYISNFAQLTLTSNCTFIPILPHAPNINIFSLRETLISTACGASHLPFIANCSVPSDGQATDE